ncbi:MAG: c-type cytochrome [Planctomycetota bacterium]
MKVKLLYGTLGSLLIAGTTLAIQNDPGGKRGNREDVATPLRGDPARGRRVFVKKICVDCHAILGSGGKLGPDLAEVGKGRSFYMLVANLWEHSPRMIKSMAERNVKWPTFKNREMADLISYLYYLNYFDKPGEYQKGKAAFEKKSCIQCHRIGGRGGEIAPSLDAYATTSSPVKMVTAMWNHGPAMVQTLARLNIAPPKFEGSEAADILAYLRASTVEAGFRTEYLSPGEPARGRMVFEKKKCAKCHPVHGQGGNGALDLASVDMRRSVSKIAGVLWNHGPLIWEKLGKVQVAIPPFTVQQMTDLIAYLYFIGYYDSRGDAEHGEKLFRDRGCFECHSEKARSESKAPLLSRMRSVGDPVSLATAFWNHAPAMMEAMGAELLSWPRFSDTELRDLAFYLRKKLKER